MHQNKKWEQDLRNAGGRPQNLTELTDFVVPKRIIVLNNFSKVNYSVNFCSVMSCSLHFWGWGDKNKKYQKELFELS
jgi:hypothetical protein